MWLTDPFVELAEAIVRLVALSFHTRMFQAKRKKDTAIWTSISELSSHLERKCEGLHDHLVWDKVDTPNGFATAEECAYNLHTCASWAQTIFDYAVKLGFHAPPCDMEHTHDDQTWPKINKTILGCLPRGSKVPPILTYWQELQLYLVPALQTLPVGKRTTDSVAPLFPPGPKLVRCTNASGVELECSGDVRLQLPKFALVGIPREPGEFVAKACTLVHPLLRAM